MAMRAFPNVSTGRRLLSTRVSPTDISASRVGLIPALNHLHAPIVYHERYSFPDWPTNHTFPMDKFGHLAKTVLNPNDTSNSLVQNELDMFRPLDFVDIPREWLAEPTGPIETDFLDRFLTARLTYDERRAISFREQTARPELIERTVLEVAGTILAGQLAWHAGLASNLAGGTHHAYREMGAGFTVLNDLAIAANFLTDPNLNQGTVTGVNRVLVVDCDVHQGDGTAKFSKLHDEERLFTLSIHCGSNYPPIKAQSSYDVDVADGVEDDEYMEILVENVNQAISEVSPDLVLYDAGVDIYRHDRLGQLNISEDGIRRRDEFVIDRCVSLGIPVAAVIGGGYDRDVDALARRHAIVHEECAKVWRKYQMWNR